MGNKLNNVSDFNSPSPSERAGVRSKILIFIDWYLPGYKAGGPIQSVSNLVENLKDEFEFFIITRDTDYCETIPYSNIKSNEWNKTSYGVNIFYISADKLTRSNIRNLIRTTDFDHVYLNGVYSLYFTLIPLVALRKYLNKHIIIASRGMLSKGSMNVKKAKKKFFIRVVKVLKLFDSVLFHATNNEELEDIKIVFGNNIQVKIAANLPQKQSSDKFIFREKKVGILKLVNVARISPEKNLLFALQILQLVKAEVMFDFYGPIYNQEYWNECKLILDSLPSNIKARYKGSIESNKVADLLNEYHFMFMPSSGENFGHIILQALSAGCPVIISDKTPWKKLHEKHVGWDIPLNHIVKYAEAIDFCAGLNQSEYEKYSRSAYEYAQKYINNPEIIKQNRQLFS